MTVKVARGLLSRIRENPGDIVIQVQRPSDVEAATVALERAREDIWNLDGGWESASGLTPKDRNNPKYVSGVARAGTGPFITIDGGYAPYGVLRTIPEVVGRRLEEAGVTEAVIDSPPKGGPLDQLGQLPWAVVLRVYATPDFPRPAEIPEVMLRAPGRRAKSVAGRAQIRTVCREFRFSPTASPGEARRHSSITPQAGLLLKPVLTASGVGTARRLICSRRAGMRAGDAVAATLSTALTAGALWPPRVEDQPHAEGC